MTVKVLQALNSEQRNRIALQSHWIAPYFSVDHSWKSLPIQASVLFDRVILTFKKLMVNSSNTGHGLLYSSVYFHLEKSQQNIRRIFSTFEHSATTLMWLVMRREFLSWSDALLVKKYDSMGKRAVLDINNERLCFKNVYSCFISYHD